ncbi:Hypothetical predicted protein [Olea europaea subsp. europaea]|uniref:Uncharacterized protein n=1 Tax=Olea europaea subsp. europaea TaxID=158383 RepID=A0A8S0Q6W8_OLEEU|nr:Hypothetical predicted protein [Olea europaea subsp. europaea]
MGGSEMSNFARTFSESDKMRQLSARLSCVSQVSRVQYSGWSYPAAKWVYFKDFEELNLIPTKIRKKLFDLQLPADEYIDTEEGEKLQDNIISSILSGKTCRRKDASGSGSCLRSSSGLADLNEPVQLEQATAPSSADFLGPSKGNPNLVARSFQKDKVTRPSHPAEVLLNRALYPPGIYPAGHSGEGIW